MHTMGSFLRACASGIWRDLFARCSHVESIREARDRYLAEGAALAIRVEQLEAENARLRACLVRELPVPAMPVGRN